MPIKPSKVTAKGNLMTKEGVVVCFIWSFNIHGIWNYMKNATKTQILRYLVTRFFFLPKKSNSTLITPNKVVGILNNFRMKGIQQLFGPNVIQF